MQDICSYQQLSRSHKSQCQRTNLATQRAETPKEFSAWCVTSEDRRGGPAQRARHCHSRNLARPSDILERSDICAGGLQFFLELGNIILRDGVVGAGEVEDEDQPQLV